MEIDTTATASNTGAESSMLDYARKRFKDCYDSVHEKKYRELSDEHVKYFTGEDQGWDKDGARAKLRSEQRPAVTLNRVSPIIRLMTGAKPKTEVRILPAEGNDLDTASVLEAAKDYVNERNGWRFIRDDAFLHYLVTLRSVVEIMPDYDDDLRGEVALNLCDGREFCWDPGATKRGKQDAKDMFRTRRMDLDEAKRLWPEFADRIDSMVSSLDSTGRGASTRDSGEADEYQDPASNYYSETDKRLTVRYYWWRDVRARTRIVNLFGTDPMTGAPRPDVYDSPLTLREAKQRLEAEGAADRFRVVSVNDTTVRFIVYCHDLLLEEGVTPWIRLDGRPTPLARTFPYLCVEMDRLIVGGRQELLSVIGPLQDPQMYHNKLASAILQIIGTSANSGWEYEDGAISPKEEKKLKKYGSTPGVNIKWKRGALAQGRARKIQPGTPPTAHMAEAKQMASDVLDISGVESLVNTEALGKGASGVAIDLKQRQGGNIISWTYEAFSFYEHLLTKWVIDAIQSLYDYEKVIQIRGYKNQPITINERVYDETGGIVQILNDITAGTYNVILRDSDEMPTARIERLKTFSEMVKTGALQLPPPVLLKVYMELMDDPELKDMVETELAEFVQQQQAQAQAAAAMGGGAMMPPEGGMVPIQ